MVTYGTGQVAGTVAADTLMIGNITVPAQGFGLVLHASVDFLDISCDGLFVRRLTPRPACLTQNCLMTRGRSQHVCCSPSLPQFGQPQG